VATEGSDGRTLVPTRRL